MKYRPIIYVYTPMPAVVVFVFVYKWQCLDHVEGTNSKPEVTQANISTNIEIKKQILGQHEIVLDTSIRNTIQTTQKWTPYRRMGSRDDYNGVFRRTWYLTFQRMTSYKLTKWTTRAPRIHKKKGELKLYGTTNNINNWTLTEELGVETIIMSFFFSGHGTWHYN